MTPATGPREPEVELMGHSSTPYPNKENTTDISMYETNSKADVHDVLVII